MPDLNRESLEIWNSLKPMVDEEIKSQTRGAVQRRKAKVTTAPSLSTNKIGVTEPYCAEIFIPFVSNLISATVGDYVWIEFAYGATNAYASMFASSDHKDETVAGNLHVMGNVSFGGNITMGTIDASVVTVDNINASNISSGTLSADRIAAGSLAIDKLDSAAQNTINGANSKEQLIYISKASGTTTQSATTTWVTNTTGNQNTWTIKRPTYNSSYPVLFVATQRKDVGGTVSCTTPQIDNTTTVIDGGHITTGTIDASVVSVTNLNASNISSGTLSAARIGAGSITANKLDSADINASKILTVGSMTDAAAATVLNSNIAIGGRNIATGTATAKTLTTAANQNYFTPSVYPLSAYSATALSDASNTQVTVSFDYSITGVDTVFSLTVGFWGGQSYNEIVTAKADIPIGSSTGHAEATKDITNNMRQYAHEADVLFSGSGNANANAVLTVSNLKVEIGNKATTWTQAPEDVAADIATAQSTAEGANSQEQLIYISKVSGTTTQSATTTWVTNTTGNQNTWTIKRPTYNSSYPVLFVATQRKSVGGTVTCTTPQIDNTTTVIDGGHITTGTIDAGVVSVTNLNASNITSGTMSASKISGGTLTLGGSNNTNGTMTVKDANGNTAATVTNAGIVVNGTNTKTTLNGGAIVIEPPSDATKAVTMEYVSNGLSQSMYLPSGGRQENGFWWKWGAYNAAYLSIPGGGRMAAQQFAQDRGLGANSANGEFLVDSLAASKVLTPKISTPTSDQVLTITGFPDVTNRRTSAVSLSELGWHRAIKIETYWRGGGSFAVDICIGRAYNDTQNEIHKITLLVNWDSFAFVDETSKSNTKIISAIRYTHDSNNGYIDIQYNSLSENNVYVDFDVHCRPTSIASFTAQLLQLVAASPSGETVLTEYTFAANTEGLVTDLFTTSKGSVLAYRSGNMVTVTFWGNSTTWTEDEVFMTVADGAKPALSYLDVAAYIGRQAVVVRINQSGNISLWIGSTLTGNNRLYFSATYPILH